MMIDRRENYGRHLIRRFLADARPYRRVLDIGAGGGDDLLAARAIEPAAALQAVEVHPPNVALLESHGVAVSRLDIERDRLPAQDGGIDVVIANQILEHTKEVFWILHEITRVLPVGGRLIVGVPNLASLHNRLLLLTGRQPTPIKTASAHVRGFTRRDLLGFLDEVFPGGYALRGHGGSNFYPFPALIARPLARALPGLAWGLFLHLEKRREYDGAFLAFPRLHRLETNFFVGKGAAGVAEEGAPVSRPS
ncbi:MAG TPA: methionine biosynthesis protein MetW [Geminicoccaceae bacterium]|nr:methionine biosynthesis protein MetW [Geminicoccaceae bacterium]